MALKFETFNFKARIWPVQFRNTNHLSANPLFLSLSLSLSLPPPPHFFSTWRERQLVASTAVSDVLVHKHHFSPEVATLVASDLVRLRKPEKVDSILSFLEKTGFSSTQLEKIVKYRPRILLARVEDDTKFKIKIFQDMGFSSEDIAKIISKTPMILVVTAKNKIIPALSVLKGLLGSDCEVARLLRLSGWFLINELEKTMVPNVEFLRRCGIPMERVVTFLYCFPRCLLIKPDVMMKSVDKAKEMGVSQSSKIFIYAVRIIASMSKGIWELKLQSFQDLGFSDSDILTMFRRAPLVFSLSMEKTKNVTDLLLATRKFNISSIVNDPASLGCSIEKRYKPRLQILGILESRNLIENWPGLPTISKLTNNELFERFIRPYSNEVGKVHFTKSYVKGK